jgi:Ca2+-binding RTX toxin-like protein
MRFRRSGVIIGGAAGDLLVGDERANQLTANGGRDVLIGGGADILSGGDGDDLLIGGATAHAGNAGDQTSIGQERR